MFDKVKVYMVGALPPLTWNSSYSLELSRALAQYIDLEFLSFKKLYRYYILLRMLKAKFLLFQMIMKNSRSKSI
ncbi:hypothetical protein FXW07_12105 [Methanosarcina sp. DH1]|uniref:hypothetical protein n=1 Tax=Methanosarcina sp. DH1 TaxID=2605695 RepID=UPI001E4EDF66|nr:hypothetical protein [Methanosarcina sp. DH1]MCC4767343.1 hypothetical protein [Methanosarcina sp. DH1]